MEAETCDVLIVGGGPAGLRAAEVISSAGKRVVLADRKPSVGRKFLVAGRGGLNLTHSEPVEKFPARYGGGSGRWTRLLADFSPADLRAWAKSLGIETFVGTSGRVFPVGQHAAPLLRRWIERLRQQGVSFRPRHELRGLRPSPRHASAPWEVTFATPEGDVTLPTRAVVLALGGASWPETGSDGGWIKLFADAGLAVTPLAPANCGYEVAWPIEFLTDAEGLPLKNIAVRAGAETMSEWVAGELLVTQYGLEGGAIYQLGRTLRGLPEPAIEIDLKPAFTLEKLIAKLGSAKPPGLFHEATRAWHLSAAARALLRTCGPIASREALAAQAKCIRVRLTRPRPIEEAISTAGGIAWDELREDLMVRRWPGVFCAGEMIDWEAPTGGYLLQGCFSTATRAALGTLRFLQL